MYKHTQEHHYRDYPITLITTFVAFHKDGYLDSSEEEYLNFYKAATDNAHDDVVVNETQESLQHLKYGGEVVFYHDKSDMLLNVDVMW